MTYQGHFAGDDMSNIYLNVTPIENITTTNTEMCVKKCMHTDGCFSLNSGPTQYILNAKGTYWKFRWMSSTCREFV